MNRKKRIINILKNNIKDFSISIIDKSYLHKGHNNFDGGNETHLTLILEPKNKNKYNRLKIHKTINDLLKSEFLNGLHALEIQIKNLF